MTSNKSDPERIDTLYSIGAVVDEENINTSIEIPNHINLKRHFPLALGVFSGELQDPIPTLEHRIARYEKMVNILQTEHIAEEIVEEVLEIPVDEELYDLYEVVNIGRKYLPGFELDRIKKKNRFQDAIKISALVVDLAGKPSDPIARTRYNELKDIFSAYLDVGMHIAETYDEFNPIMTEIAEYVFEKRAAKASLKIVDELLNTSTFIENLAEKHAPKIRRIFEEEAEYQLTGDKKANKRKEDAIDVFKRTVEVEITGYKRKLEDVAVEYTNRSRQARRMSLPPPMLPANQGALIGPVKAGGFNAGHTIAGVPIIGSGNVKYNSKNMIINPQGYSIIDFLDDVTKIDPKYKIKSLDEYKNDYIRGVQNFKKNKP